MIWCGTFFFLFICWSALLSKQQGDEALLRKCDFPGNFVETRFMSWGFRCFTKGKLYSRKWWAQSCVEISPFSFSVYDPVVLLSWSEVRCGSIPVKINAISVMIIDLQHYIDSILINSMIPHCHMCPLLVWMFYGLNKGRLCVSSRQWLCLF